MDYQQLAKWIYTSKCHENMKSPRRKCDSSICFYTFSTFHNNPCLTIELEISIWPDAAMHWSYGFMSSLRMSGKWCLKRDHKKSVRDLVLCLGWKDSEPDHQLVRHCFFFRYRRITYAFCLRLEFSDFYSRIGMMNHRSCWEILIETTSPPAPALMTWYLRCNPASTQFKNCQCENKSHRSAS